MKRPQERAEVDRELQRLVELRHPDPHSVLGVHPDGDGAVIRAVRPEAESITVLPEFGGRAEMRHRAGGVFEARINGRAEVFEYLLEVRYPGGRTFTVRDPYRFLPTLGDVDLHLIGEGRHEK
ncbi:MAG TPA: 1,4-alpha-glucan branching enzyme, partial [Myxococcaceae bacterium]|nr:1,4-alpha-glucan branching enzyme [Myxococcaceae bacterium]